MAANRCVLAQENTGVEMMIRDLNSRLSILASELAVERRNNFEADIRIKELLNQIDGLKEQRDKEVYDAQIEVELTLLQLHQIQEELDQSLKVIRKQAEIIRNNERLQEKSASLVMNVCFKLPPRF